MSNAIGDESWDPRQDLVRLQREMNQLARRAARPATRSTTRQDARVFPGVVVSTVQDQLLVRAEVPGMRLEDFEISVSADLLTLEGNRVTGEALEGGWYHRRERQSGRFSRAIRLPAAVDGGQAEATYEAGVLTVSLPLRQPAKPKEIQVKVAEG
jgi:HSP20 family protein